MSLSVRFDIYYNLLAVSSSIFFFLSQNQIKTVPSFVFILLHKAQHNSYSL